MPPNCSTIGNLLSTKSKSWGKTEAGDEVSAYTKGMGVMGEDRQAGVPWAVLHPSSHLGLRSALEGSVEVKKKGGKHLERCWRWILVWGS